MYEIGILCSYINIIYSYCIESLCPTKIHVLKAYVHVYIYIYIGAEGGNLRVNDMRRTHLSSHENVLV